MAAGGWIVCLIQLLPGNRGEGDSALLDRLVNSKLDGGIPAKNVNTMCPLLTLSYLAEETGRTDYL